MFNFLAEIFTDKREKRQSENWNNGFCRQTGKRWECFDRDSVGGRMYISLDENNNRYYLDIDTNADGLGHETLKFF